MRKILGSSLNSRYSTRAQIPGHVNDNFYPYPGTLTKELLDQCEFIYDYHNNMSCIETASQKEENLHILNDQINQEGFIQNKGQLIQFFDGNELFLNLKEPAENPNTNNPSIHNENVIPIQNTGLTQHKIAYNRYNDNFQPNILQTVFEQEFIDEIKNDAVNSNKEQNLKAIEDTTLNALPDSTTDAVFDGILNTNTVDTTDANLSAGSDTALDADEILISHTDTIAILDVGARKKPKPIMPKENIQKDFNSYTPSNSEKIQEISKTEQNREVNPSKNSVF